MRDHRTRQTEQAVAAFRASNRHAGASITHQRAGDHALAWEHRAYSRFYRTAAVGLLLGHGYPPRVTS